MKNQTKHQILSYITQCGQARVHDIVLELGISHVAVHRHIRQLLFEQKIQKVGSAPLVFYIPAGESISLVSEQRLPPDETKQIADHFLYITPQGQMFFGKEGFDHWAMQQQPNRSLTELARLYMQTIQTVKRTAEGLIDTTEKMHKTFPNSPVDHLFVADVYSYPVFGRTKLARLVMHAKQSEDRALIHQIVEIAKPYIERLLHRYGFDAVGFIPPTVPRPVQFIDEFARLLALPLPQVDLVKVQPGKILVTQKSLATVSERTANAKASIFLKTPRVSRLNRVLLVDDVVGSGASFQQTALKLRQANEGIKTISAFALVGNLKGYEVIRQI